LEDGSLRFGELKRAVGDISQRVLTENLRSLERDGHLIRTVHGGPPLAVSYALTGQGAELIHHLKPLVFWAAENFEQVNSARITYDAKK
jgi:DNA-binding HxlR family transcriptional regulator